jgi:hypothetical protein
VPQEREKTFRMLTKKIPNSLGEKANLNREILEYRDRNNIEYYSSEDDNPENEDDDDEEEEESEDEDKKNNGKDSDS